MRALERKKSLRHFRFYQSIVNNLCKEASVRLLLDYSKMFNWFKRKRYEIDRLNNIRRNNREDTYPLMDMNIYATRKTVAQGMMDIALLTANASQLKYVLSNAEEHEYFLINVALLGASMSLQIIVGIMLILVGRSNINYKKQQKGADDMNNAIVVMIFLITVVNVLISAFSVDINRDEDNPTATEFPISSSGDNSDKISEGLSRMRRHIEFWPNCSATC